jgi:hypothetical protein
MSPRGEAEPVKLFAGLLSADKNLLVATEEELAALYGAIDARSEIVPWDVSRYYEPEMGSNLLRRFVSFALPVAPEALPDIKLGTGAIERRHATAGGARRINIDPGYVDVGKVVLASTKPAGHRMYLRRGIYAEMTLLYHSGHYQAFVYTYADFQWPATTAFLADARRRYLDQLQQNDAG